MACNVILTVVVFLVWRVCLASGPATLLRSHSSEDVTMQVVLRLQYALFQPNVCGATIYSYVPSNENEPKQWHKSKRKPKNLQRNVILLVVVFVAWYTCLLGFHCHSTFVCSQTLWRWGWLYATAPNLKARQQADQNPPALLHYACFTVVNLQQTWLNIRSLWRQSMIRPCHLQAVFYFFIFDLGGWGIYWVKWII